MPTDTSASAMQRLCQNYWFPVYDYIRRRTNSTEDAQDLTQSFFAKLLETHTIASADPQRGRFRAFLLTACQRFLANEWRNGQAICRGGCVRTISLTFDQGDSSIDFEPADNTTPEIIFEQQWAMTMLNSVLAGLRHEYTARGKQALFEALKPCLSGVGEETYGKTAAKLGMQEGAVKVAVHRLKTRYRELIRAHIAETVEHANDIDDEIRRLFSAIIGKNQNSL